jgi:hypothetical protein
VVGAGSRTLSESLFGNAFISQVAKLRELASARLWGVHPIRNGKHLAVDPSAVGVALLRLGLGKKPDLRSTAVP